MASDASALLEHTRSVVYLDDGEMVVITRDGYRVRDLDALEIPKEVNLIEWDLATIERGGFEHFMLKEIFEQPQSLRNTLSGHLLEDEGTSRLEGLNLTNDELKQIDHIIITACGTSWHAGLIGEYMIEELGPCSGRGRVRVGISLSQSGGGRTHARHRHLPIRRDRRHLGRSEGGQEPRGPDDRTGQCGGIDHRP